MCGGGGGGGGGGEGLEVEVPVTYKRQPCGDNPFCSNQTANRVLRLKICYKFLVAEATCGALASAAQATEPEDFLSPQSKLCRCE